MTASLRGCVILGLLLASPWAGAQGSMPPPGSPSGVVLLGPLVGLQVSVDDRVVLPDATGFVPLAPGVEHRVVVRVPLYVPFVLHARLAPGEVQEVRPRLYRDTSLMPRPSLARRTREARAEVGFLAAHWPSLTALGLGVAGLSAGVVCHLLAERDWASLRDAARDPDGAVTGLDEREAWRLSDRARGRELGGWIGFGVGGGLLLVSTVLLAVEPFGGEVAVVPAAGGAALTGSW